MQQVSNPFPMRSGNPAEISWMLKTSPPARSPETIGNKNWMANADESRTWCLLCFKGAEIRVAANIPLEGWGFFSFCISLPASSRVINSVLGSVNSLCNGCSTLSLEWNRRREVVSRQEIQESPAITLLTHCWEIRGTCELLSAAAQQFTDFESQPERSWM